MHDLVLIKKIDFSSDCWSNLVRKKKISNLSVEEIISIYNGFEGDLILFKNINGSEIELVKSTNNDLELNTPDTYLLLHIISEPESKVVNLQNEASFLGYDVGVCQGEQSIFSSIFNEILFGNINDLIIFKDLLNENLLFPDKATAERYVDLHNEMSVQGKDVEDYMEMIIYEIWRYKD